MTAKLFDGAAFAKDFKAVLLKRAEALKLKNGRAPSLAIVSAAGDAGAKSYLQAKLKACAESGIEAKVVELSPLSGHAAALKVITEAAGDPKVDAVIVDLPLPKHVDAAAALAAVPAAKDAEGQTPERLGRLFAVKAYDELEKKRLVAPCTAVAVVEIARALAGTLSGKKAVVVGRSNIVGKPAAHLLTACDATVTVCHSKTADLEAEVSRADVVVACAGSAGLIKAAWVKEGAVVVDAGVNEVDGKLQGDVQPGAADYAAHLTPVPGGVGPVTTAVLLSNVLTLAEKH